MRQELLKGALSAAEVVGWYDKFLFGKRSGDQRAGAVRLLDQNVGRIRSGEHEAKGIQADCTIFPLLVTYDHLGADNPTFYKWLAERCATEQLLQHDGVKPMVLLNIEKFELLMGYAAAGGGIFEVLERRRPEERADVALFDAASVLESTRLPELDQRYQALMDRLLARLSRARQEGVAIDP